jgi:hypothetical protein
MDSYSVSGHTYGESRSKILGAPGGPYYTYAKSISPYMRSG